MRTWIFLGGRGAGKTISLTSAAHLAAQSGLRKIMLIAPTAADVRDILIEGRAGLLNTAPAGFRPRFVETRRKLVWPNGAEALCFSAAEPEFLRGHEAELCLIDEWAAMDYGAAVLDQASLCLRIGAIRACFIATTPQPKPWLKKLLKAPGVIVTHSTTWANEANLAPSYIADLRETWAGRKLALQELEGLIVEEDDAELFKESWLIHDPVPNEMIERVSIGVDPGGIDTTGIVACAYLVDGRYAVLADRSRQNDGGAMGRGGDPSRRRIRSVGLRNRSSRSKPTGAVRRSKTRSATRPCIWPSKASAKTLTFGFTWSTRRKESQIRASPISGLFEQGKVLMRPGLAALTAEMLNFTHGWDRARDGSPNRLDAMVWAHEPLAENQDDHHRLRGRHPARESRPAIRLADELERKISSSRRISAARWSRYDQTDRHPHGRARQRGSPRH